MAVCPICNKEYTEYPALSRRDNKTEICPKCGMREALEDFTLGSYQEVENTAYYISLTRGLTGYYIKVLAANENVAREFAQNYYSRNWCSVYQDDDIKRFIKKGYKTKIINDEDPIILNDCPTYE